MNDNLKQIAWLSQQAKFRGLAGLEDLPFELILVLGRMWRMIHPC